MIKENYEKVIEALKKATDNFNRGYFQVTLMGWTQEYDEEGRPLRTNPNYRLGETKIAGTPYMYIRRDWIVKVYEPDFKVHYLHFNSKEANKHLIAELDLEPQYVKDYYAKRTAQKENTLKV